MTPGPSLCTIWRLQARLRTVNSRDMLRPPAQLLCTFIASRSARSLAAASISLMIGDRYG